MPTLDDELQLYGNASSDDVISRLKGWGIAEIVLKNGAEGCTVAVGNSTRHVATTKVRNVVDTTAAGDSFNAGYLAAWLNGAGPAESAANGNRIASLVVQYRGAIVPKQTTRQAWGK